MSQLDALVAVSALVGAGPLDHLFTGTDEAPYAFSGLVKQYGALPTHDTILAHTGRRWAPLPSLAPIISTCSRTVRRGHAQAGRQGDQRPARPEQQRRARALKVMTEAIMMLAQRKMGKNVVDFRQATRSS